MGEYNFFASLFPRHTVQHGSKTQPGTASVAIALSRLLATTQALCRQSLYTHWQATEPDFSGLHSLFEQHYQSLRKAADAIAERIHALGYVVPKAFSQHTWGTDLDDTRPPEEMLIGLVRNHQICSREAKKVLDMADMAGDDITANLAAQRASVHDRAALVLLALIPGKRQLNA